MRRRTVLQSLAALPGVVPAADALAQTPQGSPTTPPRTIEETPHVATSVPELAGEAVPHFFGAAEFSALKRLSGIIMPPVNGTPGALEAGVPEFLDFLIGQSPAIRQKLYKDGLNRLNSAARAKTGKLFADVASSDADALLEPLRQSWTWEPPEDTLAAFLRTAKEDVLNATVNSYEWSAVVSKRSRSAGGVAAYWSTLD